MTKTFIVKNLDCAHCAEKMERAINKIKGVNEASITFMTQKLFLDADDDRFDEIVEEARKAVKKIEGDEVDLTEV